jgi:hypothetical protein
MEMNIEEVTQKAANVFPPSSLSPLTLDFSLCIIDYPAASNIIDAAIRSLPSKPLPRELIVQFNVNFEERHLLKNFLWGSDIINVEGDPSTAEGMKARLRLKLQAAQLKLILRVISSETGATLSEYRYE